MPSKQIRSSSAERWLAPAAPPTVALKVRLTEMVDQLLAVEADGGPSTTRSSTGTG